IRIRETFSEVRTNEEGTFAFKNLAAGTWHVLVSAPGYETRTYPVTIGSGIQKLACVLVSAPVSQIWHEVIITAQRNAEDPFESVAAATALSRSQIKAQAPRTTPEALMEMPGVWVQKTNHGGGSPFVRGLTGNQTLIVVDDIRLNNSTFRYGPNQYLNTIDPLTLQRAEVIRSSGSVQYGSDALGGVVHLITRSPEFAEKGFQVKPGAYLKYLSGNMERTVRGEIAVSSPSVAMLAGVSYKNFGDLIAGGTLGTLSPSSYTETNTDFKSAFRVGERSRLTMAWQSVTQENVDRYDQVAQRGYDVWMFDPQIRRIGWLRFETRRRNPLFQEIRITNSFQYSKEGRVSLKTGDTGAIHEQDIVRTSGLSFDIRSRYSSRWQSVTGAELYVDQIFSTAYKRNLSDSVITPRRGLYPDSSLAGSGAIYSLHTLDLSPWVLSSGLRLNGYYLRLEDASFGKVELRPLALAGNLALMRRIGKHSRIIAAANTGFRAPNINDMGTFGRFDSGIEVPSPNLSPERSLSGELTYKLRTRQATLWVSGYYTRLFNLIQRVPGTWEGQDSLNGDPVFRKENVAAAFIAGVDGGAEYFFTPEWIAFSGMAWAYGQNLTANEPVSRIPPLNGRLGLRYQSEKGLRVQGECVFAGMQDRLSTGDTKDHRIPAGGTPGWYLLNVHAAWQYQQFYLSAGAQNLLNRAYRVHGSGVDGYGRSFWVALTMEPFR
ncbi:MAG: TonB-dependent receptor, partial [Bacteroidetes bacterium]